MMDGAKARLRKTFKYPSDTEDSGASRDELDEEEQSALLTHLSTTTTQHDTTYRLIFTVLPLLSVLPFVYSLLIHPSRTTALPTLLAITSLSITAWGMFSVPTNASSLAAAGRQSTRPSVIFAPTSATLVPTSTSASASALGAAGEGQGPLGKYLPRLNVLIAVLLLGVSYLFSARTDVNEGFWMLLLLPAVMLGVVAVVKASMLEIQSGLGELEGLKYEYKGA